MKSCIVERPERLVIEKEETATMPDYREIMSDCIAQAKAMLFEGTEYTREHVLKQVREYVETDEYRNLDSERDFLWIVNSKEIQEKGVYCWKQTAMDVAVVGTAAIMALLMGEYELAKRCCERRKISYVDETGKEIYQSEGIAYIGGSEFNFIELCFLCSEMPDGYKEFFLKEFMNQVEDLNSEKHCFLENFVFDGTESVTYNVMLRPIRFLSAVQNINPEAVCTFFPILVEYIMERKMDQENQTVWQELFEAFGRTEERQLLMQWLHCWVYYRFNGEDTPVSYEERLQKAVEIYFQYEDSLNMEEHVRFYVLQRILLPSYVTGSRKKYLCAYLDRVKRFEGEADMEWDRCVYEIFKSNDVELCSRCLKNNFIQKNRLMDYIEYCLEKGEMNAVWIPNLIRLKWLVEENIK